MQRREFIQSAATAPLLAGGAASAAAPQEAAEMPALPRLDPANEVVRGDMRYRKLGKTGAEVSCIGLGGFHIGIPPTDEQSVKLVRAAIDAGITFMDNCWDYHQGTSELRMGKALQDGYRKKVFLMTKIDGRTKAEAARQLDQCLLRLRTDVIDLVQYHEMLRMEDADRVFGEHGAHEAVEAARKAGKVRFIGFTGHKDPLVHLRTLEVAKEHGFRFDAVQMPVNCFDAHFRSFSRNVLPVLAKERIGALCMKPIGSGELLDAKVVTAPECLRFSLSLASDVVITGMETLDRLKQALGVVKDFKPLTDDELAALLKKTRDAARGGKYEKFKTGVQFDSTAKHPEYLGGPEA